MIVSEIVVSKDEEFLFKLYASTREKEISGWGWGANEREAFLRMQFHAQRSHYTAQYPNSEHRIIYKDDDPIGRIYLSKNENSMILVDISILPNYQRQGIGTQQIQILQDEAAKSNQQLILHVHRGNPAQNLYSRLGFTCKEVNEVYMRMEWN